MYFWVYHKQAKQSLGPFNENSIVDFCMKNKENIKNYYFSTGGKKDLMEWEAFAAKHSSLFERKAKERAEKEDHEETSARESEKSGSSTLLISIIVIIILGLGGAGVFFFLMPKEKPKKSITDTGVKKKVPLVKKEPEKEISYPMKREPLESDSKFIGKAPGRKELLKAWKKHSKSLKKSLSHIDIKAQMDGYLPDLKSCYIERAKSGDKKLRGVINLKIRVSGNGQVIDVLLNDDRLKSTLFGDCIIKAIKLKPFKMFKSQEQVFTYYYTL